LVFFTKFTVAKYVKYIIGQGNIPHGTPPMCELYEFSAKIKILLFWTDLHKFAPAKNN